MRAYSIVYDVECICGYVTVEEQFGLLSQSSMLQIVIGEISMKILQSGLPKSGNFWLSQILRAIYDEYNLDRPCYIAEQPIYEVSKTWIKSVQLVDGAKGLDVIEIKPNGSFIIIGTMYRELIEDFDDYVSQVSHVWTHSSLCSRSFEVFPKFDKVVYILRDPRDVVISKSHFQFTDYMKKHHPKQSLKDPDLYLERHLVNSTRHWMQHVGGYLAYANQLNIHMMFYERMKADLKNELIALLEYLELEPSEAVLENIRARVSLEGMKRDNPNHVREGKSGGWRDSLTPKQQKIALQTAKPLLSLLNYPLTAQDESLPNLPEHYSVDDIRNAVRTPLASRVWTAVRESARIIIKPEELPSPPTRTEAPNAR